MKVKTPSEVISRSSLVIVKDTSSPSASVAVAAVSYTHLTLPTKRIV